MNLWIYNISQLSVRLIWSACVPAWVIAYWDAYASHWYASHAFKPVRARLLHSRPHTWPAWRAGVVPRTIAIWDSPAKFGVLSVAEMTEGESYRFFDAQNEYGWRNCLTLQVKWPKNVHFGQIYKFIVVKRNFFLFKKTSPCSTSFQL